MNELKFRVWLGKHKQMIYPSICDFIKSEDGMIIGQIFPNFKFKSGLEFYAQYVYSHFDKTSMGLTEDYYSDIDHSIMQYTGLKDKNGKEIYEGDIVKFGEPTKLAEDLYMSSLYVFNFYEGSFTRPYIYNSINGSKFVKMEAGALNPVGRAKLDDNQHFDWTKAEVLGNILTNPELIDR